MAQNDYDGLEHGGVLLQWLDEKQTKEQFGVGMQQARRHGIKSLSSAEINSPLMFQGQSRSSQRPQRTRNQKNWASSGPGMQAIFLGSNQRSCGTGVFIPRTEGTDFQFSNKPAFSPVLLPSRVVQALNLNVHELGQQIKPQPEQHKSFVKKIDEKLEKKKADDVCFSPEIFLPKEWTY